MLILLFPYGVFTNCCSCACLASRNCLAFNCYRSRAILAREPKVELAAMDNRWSLYKLHYVHLHSTLLKSPLPLLLPLSGLESPPSSFPSPIPLSAPLRPTPAEVRNPLRYPLTLRTALPLHSALYPPNTTSASSARFQTPKQQPFQPHKTGQSSAHLLSPKNERSPASPKQLDTAAARPLNLSAERSSPFHFPHHGPIIDCSRESEIM